MNDVLFEREVYFYQKLAPKLIEFQRKKGLSVDLMFTQYPKCLHVEIIPDTGEYIMVFEDLCAQGFELWPRKIANPFENLILVVRSLAKLHAVSFVMKDQEPELFADIKELPDVFIKFVSSDDGLKLYTTGLTEAMNSLDNPEHVDILHHVINDVRKYFEDFLDIKKLGRFGVIGHGDSHNNNILYRTANVILIYLQ